MKASSLTFKPKNEVIPPKDFESSCPKGEWVNKIKAYWNNQISGIQIHCSESRYLSKIGNGEKSHVLDLEDINRIEIKEGRNSLMYLKIYSNIGSSSSYGGKNYKKEYIEKCSSSQKMTGIKGKEAKDGIYEMNIICEK